MEEYESIMFSRKLGKLMRMRKQYGTRLKIDAAIWNVFPKCVCSATPPQTRRLLPRFGKFFSEESEGFFRRALGSYTHKFPKHGAALLTNLPRSRLDLPHLRLSWNSGPATEGFSNRSVNFKDAYRIYQAFSSPNLEGLGTRLGRKGQYYYMSNGKVVKDGQVQSFLSITGSKRTYMYVCTSGVLSSKIG